MHYLPNENSLSFFFFSFKNIKAEHGIFLLSLTFAVVLPPTPTSYFFSSYGTLLPSLLAFCNSAFLVFFVLNSCILLVVISGHTMISIFYDLNKVFKRLGPLLPNLFCIRIVCVFGSISLITT